MLFVVLYGIERVKIARLLAGIGEVKQIAEALGNKVGRADVGGNVHNVQIGEAVVCIGTDAVAADAGGNNGGREEVLILHRIAPVLSLHNGSLGPVAVVSEEGGMNATTILVKEADIAFDVSAVGIHGVEYRLFRLSQGNGDGNDGLAVGRNNDLADLLTLDGIGHVGVDLGGGQSVDELTVFINLKAVLDDELIGSQRIVAASGVD